MTNDDGVGSEGLLLLAAAASECGLDVTVVAPSFDASGSSASMNAATRNGKVLVERIPDDGSGEGPDDGRVQVLGVQGPPAFIVRAAMFGAFGPPPDLVLSGVNRGLNTGRAILHSGTVGAALTAATYGRRGLALSSEVLELQDAGAPGWLPGLDLVLQALGWLRQVPDATVLNVNVPAGNRDGRKGSRATCLAEAGTVQGQVTELDQGFVPVVFSGGDGSPAEGTDAAALAEGFVSVTAIRAVVEDDRLDLAALLASA